MLKHYIAAMLVTAAAMVPLSHAQAQISRSDLSETRVDAVHDCSSLAERYPETTFGNTEFYLYRSCMARQGQVE